MCERLRLLGDLGPDEAVACDNRYTAAVAGAVKRFQARHSLQEDGIFGPTTLSALAVPISYRVAQLELTLERLRWLPPLQRGRFIVVNVPTYRLWAIDSSDDLSAPMLEMRVIVGTAARTPTPLFIGQMRYLEFNPYGTFRQVYRRRRSSRSWHTIWLICDRTTWNWLERTDGCCNWL